MKKWQDQFSIHALCRAMDVKRGTFYNYLFRSKPQTLYSKTDEMLRPLIQTVFNESKERFGANKIRIKLAEQGIKVSAAHIKRLMKEMNLLAKQARLRCYNSTNRQYMYRRNRVHQDFTRTAPNQLWVSDVTYARVNADFYAICVIIDIFSRKVLAHKISRQNNTTLVLAAFQDAFEKRGNPQNLLLPQFNTCSSSGVFDRLLMKKSFDLLRLFLNASHMGFCMFFKLSIPFCRRSFGKGRFQIPVQ